MASDDRSNVNRLKNMLTCEYNFINGDCTSSTRKTQGHSLPYVRKILALLIDEKYNLERAMRHQPSTSKIDA